MKAKSTILAIILICATMSFGQKVPEFGAGEMLKPGRIYYVSTKGNDQNDGKTLETAWNSVKRGIWALRHPGDTLLIDEGTYYVSEAQVNVSDDTVGCSDQCGKPGSPIRIAGMPGKKVVFCGSRYMANPETQVAENVYEFKLNTKVKYDTIMESPSQIQLQRVFTRELAMEYPGTFYVDDSNTALVHYAAVNQDGIFIANDRIGLRIHGSWILVENLTFIHYYEGIYIRMNRPYDKNVAEHITIRDCNFFYNHKNGVTNDAASFSLFTRNRGLMNGYRGTMMMLGKSHDNLYTGNWFGPGPLTTRNTKNFDVNYALNEYDGDPMSARNYVIGNVLENHLSFRWKPQAQDARFEDNMCYGNYHVESPVRPIAIKRNWIAGRITHLGFSNDLWKADFKGTPIVFEGNVKDRKDFKPENKIVFEAEKLRMELPVIQYPEVKFTDVQVKFIEHDSAAILWKTPESDGWGSVTYRIKGSKAQKKLTCKGQGTRHGIQLPDLKPDTEYEYMLGFNGRRNQKASSEWFSFRTAKTGRAPKTLEVGPGKLTLEEAALAVIPGDTVLILPGTYSGQFIPERNGLPDKPITIKGKPGAVIDGQLFYAPLIDISTKKHYIIDGISFRRPENHSYRGIIAITRASDITIKNCRADEYEWTAGAMVRGVPSENVRIINNISRGGDYPIHLSGKKLYVANNTIVDATMISLLVWGFEDITIKDNIFYRPCIPEKRNTAMMFNDVNGKIVSDGNVFWSPVKEHPVGGTLRNSAGKVLHKSQTLKEWQEISGNDMHSLNVDPMFVDYEKGDFRLKKGSPAKGKGANLEFK